MNNPGYRRTSGSTAARAHVGQSQAVDCADLTRAAWQTPATESQHSASVGPLSHLICGEPQLVSQTAVCETFPVPPSDDFILDNRKPPSAKGACFKTQY